MHSMHGRAPAQTSPALTSPATRCVRPDRAATVPDPPASRAEARYAARPLSCRHSATHVSPVRSRAIATTSSA